MLFPFSPSPVAPPRVVVTGAGIVTAFGIGWTLNAAGFRAGRAAFRPVSGFDVSRQRVKTAAEVDLPSVLPNTRLGARAIARLDRAGSMLIHAADEAWRQAGWEPAENLPLILGTTAGGMLLGERYFQQALHQPLRHRQQAVRAVYFQSQVQARMVLDALGFSGPVTIVSNACASGGSAIGQAWDSIRQGQTERVLAGGYDALNELVFSGFNSLQALSPTVCRPFDARRDGLALGEGAAVVALETLENARRRGATILGEIVGCGACIDTHHLTQPHPQGATTLTAMKQACAKACLAPEDIDYINAHGTGTVLNDRSEALAIGEWAGRHAAAVRVSSTKACVGHLLGSAGSVEAVVCLMALQGQWLPPELEFETIDPVCQFHVVREPREARLNFALSNSFGFGGINSTLIFRRWA